MPSMEETRDSWASWLPFQCMPLPFGSHKPSQLPPTSAPSNAQEHARRAHTWDEKKRYKIGGKKNGDTSLVYEQPLQHPRPTTAPELGSRQLGFSDVFMGSRGKNEEDDVSSATSTMTTRVVIMPYPPVAGPSQRPATSPTNRTDTDTHRRVISEPIEVRHISSGAHLAQASSTDELRRHLASKALQSHLEAAGADKRAAGFRRLNRQRSLPMLDFKHSRERSVGSMKSSAFTYPGHAVTQIKTLPAESTESLENTVTCGIVRSRSVPSVKKPHAAEATNNTPCRPSTASSDKTNVSDMSDFPPPPLPLIFLPNPEKVQSGTRSFSAKGGNRTKPPPNALMTNPVPLKAKDGFYQAVSSGDPSDYGSNYSLDSATTWNTDDLYGVPPSLSPTNKVVMKRVQHGDPEIMSVEGIHGLSPSMRNRYSIYRGK